MGQDEDCEQDERGEHGDAHWIAVIPAQAGIQPVAGTREAHKRLSSDWIPACAGMTGVL